MQVVASAGLMECINTKVVGMANASVDFFSS